MLDCKQNLQNGIVWEYKLDLCHVYASICNTIQSEWYID